MMSLNSVAHFCRTFLGETYHRKMTAQQQTALASIDDDTIPKLSMCCFRGFGKSSYGEAKAIHGVCFRTMKHAMFVGSNEGLATDTTENIKTELLTNQFIKGVFGCFKPKTKVDMPFGFSKKSYFLVDPEDESRSIAFIHPKGAKQRVRGVRMKVDGRTYRPTFISIDDLEDDEEVLNSETRAKLSRWFHSALLHCVDQERPDPKTNRWKPDPKNPLWVPPWRILYTDTLKHADALMTHIQSDTEWVSHNYPQAEFRLDDDGKKRLYSLVPELTNTQVRAEYEAAKARPGGLTGYCQEKLCSPMSEEDACWNREMYHYYDEQTVGDTNSMYGLNKDPEVERFVIVDPARTNNMKSCPSGILYCGVDYKRGKVYFRKEINQRMSQDEMLATTFNTAFDMNTRTIAVEITGLGDAGKWMWVNYAQMKGYNEFEFVWLEAKGLPKGDFGKGDDAAKRARASQILPLYQQHMVHHDVSLRGGALEAQQLSYPMSVQWDILDCAGYVPVMLDLSGRTFDAKATRQFDAPPPRLDDSLDWDEVTEALREGAWRRV